MLVTFREYLVLAFTSSEEIATMTNSIIFLVLIVAALDFCQAVLCGVIKALGQQKPAAYINVVTYYVIAIPLGYYFAFKGGYG